jgi:hypothetical protein
VHVLLAGLAPQWSTNVPHWTEDARTIFVRAVLAAGGFINMDLLVVTTKLPPGVVGEEYHATLNAISGTKPYTWAVIDGALPARLELDSVTGVISGISTETGTFNFTVEATDAAGAIATRKLSISIIARTEFITDPVGDQFYGYGPNVVGADFHRGEETIYLRVRTAEPVDTTNTRNLMWLDLDLNAETGFVSTYPDIPTNDIGADAYAFIYPAGLYGTMGEEWSLPFRRTSGGRQLETEPAQVSSAGLVGGLWLWDPDYEYFYYAGNFPVFTNTDYFWFAIPLDMLGDDGIMAVVDVIGDYWEPTDVAPNEGHGITEYTYNLTISSTAGGNVTTPGEGTFTYDAGTVVDLVATPNAGYRFVNWTGDVGTIADVEDATTTITMHGNYSITANFVAVPVPACFIATVAYGTPMAEEI